MQINPYVAARIAEDQRVEAHARARRSRVERDARTEAQPGRRRIGLAIARVGFRIAGVSIAPAH